MTEILSVVAVNRGTWSIAVLGSFIPGMRLVGLHITTIIAAILELLCLARACQLAHDTFKFNQYETDSLSGSVTDTSISAIPIITSVCSIVFVVLEASVLFFGK
jgi:hypothetical protein